MALVGARQDRLARQDPAGVEIHVGFEADAEHLRRRIKNDRKSGDDTDKKEIRYSYLELALR